MAKSQDLLLRAHVWLVASLIPLAVRIVPLKRLLRLLTSSRGLRVYRDVPAERVVRIVRRRLAAPRNMRRRACLRAGLTLFHFLRLSGRPAVLHFGVYPANGPAGPMHAHCWVTLHGRPVSPPAEGLHAPMLVHGDDARPHVQ